MANNAKMAYYRRQKGKQVKEIAKLHVIERAFAPVVKASNQLIDPFDEIKQSFDQTVKPPYPLTTLLNFFEENTWNNACINLKSNLVCGDFDIKPVEEGQKEDAEYNKLMEFIERPNEDGEDLLDIFNKFWIDVEAIGNGYFEIARNSVGGMVEIYHMPGHTVRKAKTLPGYYHVRTAWYSSKMAYFKAYGVKDTQSGNDVIHHKNYFPGSKFYGMPDYVPALGAMLLDKNSILFNNAFFENGGMLGMILFLFGTELSPDARFELKNMMQGNYTGVQNAHRMAIIDNLDKDRTEVKIEKVMETMRDMYFLRGRQFNRDEIIAAHHVPPKMLHVAEPGKLGESKDGYNQMKMFKIFEIDPSQRRFENIVNKKILQKELGITKWQIKFKELDIRDPKDETDEIRGDLQAGLLTMDEAREMRGREPLQGEATVKRKIEVIEKAIRTLENELYQEEL
jgi:HK97 family phage portal protein